MWCRSATRKRLAYVAVVLALFVGGTVGAVVTFRSAIPFSTAASWSAATGSDPNAVRGPWFNTSENSYVHTNTGGSGTDWQIDQITYSVKAFGAKGDSATDDTAAINAAITAASAGGVVFFPAATYKAPSSITANVAGVTLDLGHATINSSAANCIVVSAANVTIRGGTLNMLATGATQFGINPSGTVTNLTVSGVTVNGTGATTDNQTGFGNFSGQTLTNIDIEENIFQNLVVGISLNADAGGSITGGIIRHNKVLASVGTNAGQGYGIHHANGSGNPSMVIIEGNDVENCQRHDIYQARGSGVTIIGNRSFNHRSSVGSGVQRPAIVVARSTNITVVGNVIESPSDGAIEVSADSSEVVNSIVVANNVVRNWKLFAALTVGTGTPSVDTFPTDITINGNSFYNDVSVSGAAGAAITAMRFQAGKKINVTNNLIDISNATTSSNVTDANLYVFNQPSDGITTSLLHAVATGGPFIFSGTVDVAASGAWLVGNGNMNQVALQSAVNNIFYNSSTADPPSFTTRSDGERITFLSAVDGSHSDYAMGLDASAMWFDLPTTGANGFRFYGGTTLGAEITTSGIYANNIGSNIASASTIAPLAGVTHITGTATIQTITIPNDCDKTASFGCCLHLIPDGLWATNTGGNIALASTAVVNKVLEECYDNGTTEWYPSY